MFGLGIARISAQTRRARSSFLVKCPIAERSVIEPRLQFFAAGLSDSKDALIVTARAIYSGSAVQGPIVARDLLPFGEPLYEPRSLDVWVARETKDERRGVNR